MRANTTKDKPKLDKVLPPCRVSTPELLAFKQKAKTAGLSLSALQRQALHNCAVIVREPVADVRLITELSAIGNNLNQLARNEHIHDKADTVKMREILAAIDIIVMSLINDSES